MKNINILLCIMLVFASCAKKAKEQTANASEKKPNAITFEEERKETEAMRPVYKVRDTNPQKVAQARVEPPFWWAGMKNPEVQLLLHDNLIQDHQVSIAHPGVKVKKVDKADNPNYLFITLDISPNAKIGKFNISLKKGSEEKTYPYEIKARKRDATRIQGLTNRDVIYLIMPDRFANGDESNDSVEGMNQTGTNRERILQRHGGDLQGIINKLDYLSDLGVTALWLNPVFENNQPYESYHGYAITDHYNVDARFGNNALFEKLVDECHKKGIKIVKDVIQNHCGERHWFIQDLPFKDWIHQWPTFTRTTFQAPTLIDKYASEDDLKLMTDGWFDYHMPDLNQKNPFLANYLIQNTIWWAESTGLDAFRIDTYFYPDLAFSKQWMDRLQAEYPQIGLFGETWVHTVELQNYFIENTNVPAVTDFHLSFAINEALNKPQGWTDGISKVYYALSHDLVYKNPEKNVIFLDNHDLSRYTTTINGDMNKFKAGLSMLLSTRGIPSIYYATEIMMTGQGGGFGEGGRRDFPGGWKNDASDKFAAAGRTERENEAFNFLKKLLTYRKNTPTLYEGKLVQFVPSEGVYVFFRYDDKKTIMAIWNTHDKATEFATARYKERMNGFSKAKDVISEKMLDNLEKISIEKNSFLLLELMP